MCSERFEGPRATESLVRLTCRRDIVFLGYFSLLTMETMLYFSSDCVSFNMSLCAVSNRNEKTRSSHFYWSERSGSPTRYLFSFFLFTTFEFAASSRGGAQLSATHLSLSIWCLHWIWMGWIETIKKKKWNTKIEIMFWSRAVNILFKHPISCDGVAGLSCGTMSTSNRSEISKVNK